MNLSNNIPMVVIYGQRKFWTVYSNGKTKQPPNMLDDLQWKEFENIFENLR